MKARRAIRLGLARVVNKNNHRARDGELDLYIGRPSLLGNPFPIDGDHARKDVLEMYEVYILKQLREEAPLRRLVTSVASELRYGANVNLVCFCKPEACHGDFLAGLLNDLARKGGPK